MQAGYSERRYEHIEDVAEDFSHRFDMQMYVLTGSGRERTFHHYRKLLEGAGFGACRVVPTVGPLQIVEGVRQLQGKYGPDRQVKDAEIGLISGHGGNTVCESTLILGSA